MNPISININVDTLPKNLIFSKVEKVVADIKTQEAALGIIEDYRGILRELKSLIYSNNHNRNLLDIVGQNKNSSLYSLIIKEALNLSKKEFDVYVPQPTIQPVRAQPSAQIAERNIPWEENDIAVLANLGIADIKISSSSNFDQLNYILKMEDGTIHSCSVKTKGIRNADTFSQDVRATIIEMIALSEQLSPSNIAATISNLREGMDIRVNNYALFGKWQEKRSQPVQAQPSALREEKPIQKKAEIPANIKNTAQIAERNIPWEENDIAVLANLGIEDIKISSSSNFDQLNYILKMEDGTIHSCSVKTKGIRNADTFSQDVRATIIEMIALSEQLSPSNLAATISNLREGMDIRVNNYALFGKWETKLGL